jgi:hypothetical protein
VTADSADPLPGPRGPASVNLPKSYRLVQEVGLQTGTQVLGEPFPGVLDELVTASAIVVGDDDFSRVYAPLGPYELIRTAKLQIPTRVYVQSKALRLAQI